MCLKIQATLSQSITACFGICIANKDQRMDNEKAVQVFEHIK